MNPFEMVVAIIIVVTVGRVLMARYGVIRTKDGETVRFRDDPAAAAETLKQHIIDHTPWGAKVEVEIFDVNHGFATDPSRPAIALLGECLQEAYKETEGSDRAPAGVSTDLVSVGSGGSIPLTATLQKHYPDAAIAMYGVEDNNAGIHSIDESVHPYDIERVAVAEAKFLQRVTTL